MRFFTILLFFTFIFGESQAQNSLNMDLRGNWSVDTLPTASGIRYNDVWGYVDCNGLEYAIVGSAGYIHFISLIDPDNPVEVASFAGGQNLVWRDMKVFQDRAYAVSDGGSEGMMIFDLSGLPYVVTQTYASDEIFSQAHNIYIEETTGRAYVVGSNASLGDIFILDLTADPDNPTVIGEPELPGGGYIHDIYVRDNIAYASHGWNGLYIWDLNDPQNPVFISSLITGGYNHSSWVTADGEHVVYAEEVPEGLPLGIIDISDIQQTGMNLVTTFKFPLLAPDHVNNRPHNPYIRDNFIVTSYYQDGLQIFDMSDPMNPEQVAYYDTHENDSYSGFSGVWGAYPYLPSGLILASDVSTGLYVLEAMDINFSPIVPTVFPDADISISGSNEACEGESIEINITEGAENYKWFKDGVEVQEALASTYGATESGFYFAEASNGHCSTLSEAQEIVIKENPDVSGIGNNSFDICPESSVTFEAPQGYDLYYWFLDGVMLQTDNSNTLEASDEGEYSLSATVNGCEASSGVNSVFHLPEPSLTFGFDGTLVLCDGVESTISVEAVTNVASIQWFYNGNPVDGDLEGVAIQGGGTYYAELTSADDCVANSDEVLVEISTTDVPTVTVMDQLLSSTAASFYQWYFDGNPIDGANAQSFEVTESGMYSVEVFNEFGCNAFSEVVEIIITSIHNAEFVQSFRLFPNPSKDFAKLSFSMEKQMEGIIEIRNANGKLVRSIAFDTNELEMELDIREWITGLYVVSIVGENGVFSRKLIVN